ncbi:hypothetical protein Tco_0504389, partial [Tanacetum coccineum]
LLEQKENQKVLLEQVMLLEHKLHKLQKVEQVMLVHRLLLDPPLKRTKKSASRLTPESNAGTQASKGGTSNAGTQASKGGTSNAGTSNAGTQAS